MVPPETGYWPTRFLLQRGLAVIYLAAFLVAPTHTAGCKSVKNLADSGWRVSSRSYSQQYQFRPLAGEDGLLPFREYVDRRAFAERPSLFYFVPSDRAVAAAAWAGVALAVAALVGVPYWLPEPFPTPASVALWAAMWALYPSFVNAGQLFYGYGWESMLLETGFLAVFLGAGGAGPPVVVIWLFKWALFRNVFGAGLLKVRGDDCWRELTCLDYHYDIQRNRARMLRRRYKEAVLRHGCRGRRV